MSNTSAKAEANIKVSLVEGKQQRVSCEHPTSLVKAVSAGKAAEELKESKPLDVVSTANSAAKSVKKQNVIEEEFDEDKETSSLQMQLK